MTLKQDKPKEQDWNTFVSNVVKQEDFFVR